MTESLRCEIFPGDLDQTVAFYVGVLGFRLTRDDRATDRAYIALERGTVRIGAAARPEIEHPEARRPPIGVELVLEVDDLDAERARVADAGCPVTEDVVRRPWGLRDLRLLDPSGHYWRITSREPS